MPSTIVVEVLNTHHMIITCFHIPAPGMGSLLSDSFEKEVGKRKWCETFAGPLVRRLSRAGGLRFIFSKEMLIFLCTKENTIHTRKKSTKKKTQFIPQKKHTQKSWFPFFLLQFLLFSVFCVFSAFGKSLLLKHFQLASPAQPQPPSSASQPARPLVPQPPGSAPNPCPGSVQQPRPLYVLYTHILLFCHRRCDGQHSKP